MSPCDFGPFDARTRTLSELLSEKGAMSSVPWSVPEARPNRQIAMIPIVRAMSIRPGDGAQSGYAGALTVGSSVL